MTNNEAKQLQRIPTISYDGPSTVGAGETIESKVAANLERFEAAAPLMSAKTLMTAAVNLGNVDLATMRDASCHELELLAKYMEEAANEPPIHDLMPERIGKLQAALDVAVRNIRHQVKLLRSAK